jgi:uncharacterized coiled-coil protein SlyX
MDGVEKNSKRLTELETNVMHLQSDFEALNSVVLENTRRLEEMRVMIERLLVQVKSKDETARPRNLEDEKPPHY